MVPPRNFFSSKYIGRNVRLRNLTRGRAAEYTQLLTAIMAKAFFKVVAPSEARAILTDIAPIATEAIDTVRARGRVLAEDLTSQVDLPHFARAAMDGYAVIGKDTFGASASQPAYLKLAGTVDMGKEATRRVEKGEAIRISTGGMMPPGSDAVVMVEYTEEAAGTVEVQRSVSP